MKPLRLMIALLVGVLVLLGCSSGAAELSAEDEIAIYSAVVRQVAGPDDTFGGTLAKPILYIVRHTDDAAGDPGATRAEPAALSEEVQEGVTAALGDLPSEIVWIDSREDVEFDPNTGALADGGVIVTVGNIQRQDGGEVQVAGSIYVAGLAAGGKTYVLQEQDGQWVVTGTTGVEWIS